MPPTALSRTYFSSACVRSHYVVITLIVAMVAKHTMTKPVMLHLLDCAELGGIWDEDLCHPSSKNFSSKFSGSVFSAGPTFVTWKKVIMRKTVDVDTNKVIQVKYIGDENWGNLKEKIENGPKKVKTFMVYLNVESDMDTIMDYIIDPVAGSPTVALRANQGDS